MSKLLYTEQLMWVRQEKARMNGQNYMKLSPNDIELLLNTICAERCLNENLTKERDAALAELETMRGLCQTLEVNLSGQNDTVEIMHQALVEIEHGPVGYWNEPAHAQSVIQEFMRIARAALVKL